MCVNMWLYGLVRMWRYEDYEDVAVWGMCRYDSIWPVRMWLTMASGDMDLRVL